MGFQDFTRLFDQDHAWRSTSKISCILCSCGRRATNDALLFEDSRVLLAQHLVQAILTVIKAFRQPRDLGYLLLKQGTLPSLHASLPCSIVHTPDFLVFW